MTGPQIKVKTNYPYVNIRKSLFDDTRIKPQTKYLLFFMLSLRSDWDYSIRGLAKVTHMSKDTISKMLRELENAGYLTREAQPHEEKGRWGKVSYILTDVPAIDKANVLFYRTRIYRIRNSRRK